MRSTVFNPSAIRDSPGTSRRPAGGSRSSRSPVATPRHLARAHQPQGAVRPYGSADVLRVVDVPRPPVDVGQVLVRGAAAAIPARSPSGTVRKTPWHGHTFPTTSGRPVSPRRL